MRMMGQRRIRRWNVITHYQLQIGKNFLLFLRGYMRMRFFSRSYWGDFPWFAFCIDISWPSQVATRCCRHRRTYFKYVFYGLIVLRNGSFIDFWLLSRNYGIRYYTLFFYDFFFVFFRNITTRIVRSITISLHIQFPMNNGAALFFLDFDII